MIRFPQSSAAARTQAVAPATPLVAAPPAPGPYTIFYIMGFTALLIVWYLLGLPLGPGTPVSI